MSHHYGDEEVYGVPEPVFSHKRRYGGGETAPAKKRKTASKMADKKGSSKSSGVRATEFRYASIYNALRSIAEELGGVQVNSKNGGSSLTNVSWAKPAVLMIASALEYKLKKLLRDANSFTTFTKKKTVSVAAVERAAESDGIPLSVIRGPCQERSDADAVVEKVSGKKAPTGDKAARGAQSKAAHTRKVNSEAAAKTRECRHTDFLRNATDIRGFLLVSKAVSKASVKSLLTIVGAERSSSNDIHMVMTNIAYGFLAIIVRNLIAVLTLHKASRVTEHHAKIILQGVGITSVGFSGISKIERQKRVKKVAEDVAEAADAMMAGGGAPMFNPPPMAGMV